MNPESQPGASLGSKSRSPRRNLPPPVPALNSLPSNSLPSAAMPVSERNSNAKGFRSLLTLELCAGSAGLTAELRSIGFDAVGIDHTKNRHACKAPCVLLDLSTEHGQQICLLAINSGRLFYLHAGVPCGTASKAREKKVPAHLKAQGAPEPKPLRSLEHPLGFPHLRGLDAEKVLQANAIYLFVFKCIEMCSSKGIFWSIENPRGSYLWAIPGFAELITLASKMAKPTGNPKVDCFIVDFQSCNHGGKRDKWTRLLTNMKELCALAGACTGDHAHLPWGVSLVGASWQFATASEAAYPQQLCRSMARYVEQAASRFGFQPRAEALADGPLFDTEAERLRQRGAVGKQPRGRKLPPLIPEYKEVIVKQLAVNLTNMLPAVGKYVMVPLPGIPVGARLLRRQPVATMAEGSTQQLEFQAAFGVPWTPDEFIAKLSEARHPIDSMSGTKDSVKQAIFGVLTTGEEATSLRRKQWLDKWSKVGKQLEAKEQALHAAMTKEVAKVLEGKKLLLLGAMLKSISYPDTELVKDIVSGFSLTGFQKSANVFSHRTKLPEITVQELMRTCKLNRDACLRTVSASTDIDLDREVWRQTQIEVDKGWLSGPFSFDQVSNQLGPLWTLARRFGISQADKVRVIDDYSEPYVNAAYGGLDKLDLGGVDEIAAMIREVLLSVADDRMVNVSLSTGEVMQGSLHASLSVKEARSLVGRTLDLQSAYRQLAVAPSAAWSSVVAVFNPVSQRAEIYVQRALPFGATAAVYAFNRLARALWGLGVQGLHLWWSQFFDDFPTLSLSVGAASSRNSAEGLMSMLGCSFATEDKKNKPFLSTFTALGVEFRLENSVAKCYEIANKAGRADGIALQVRNVLAKGYMSAQEAAELRGRFQYATAQLFGRVMVPAMRQLSVRSHALGSAHLLHSRLEAALRALVEFVQHGKPRLIDLNDKRKPVLVFTDGACEGSGFSEVTVGGLLIDLEYGDRECFGCRVDDCIVEAWTGGCPSQTIGQAELLPIALARQQWTQRLQGRKVLYCVDNDSARDAMVKGDSPSAASSQIIDAFYRMEFLRPCWPWFLRVASASNPADAPSRLCFQYMSLLGAIRCRPVMPTVVDGRLNFL